jgi:hypothetical protein
VSKVPGALHLIYYTVHFYSNVPLLTQCPEHSPLFIATVPICCYLSILEIYRERCSLMRENPVVLQLSSFWIFPVSSVIGGLAGAVQFHATY